MSDKRTQLLEASIDLFSKEGFWSTSTTRISKHAGVATGTLFNYFESKDILINELYLHLKQEAMQCIMTDLPEGEDYYEIFKHCFIAYCNWSVKHPDRFLLLEQLKLSAMISNETQERGMEHFYPLLQLFNDAIKKKVLKKAADGYLLTQLSSHFENAVKFAIQNELKGKALSTFQDQAFETCWTGIAN